MRTPLRIALLLAAGLLFFGEAEGQQYKKKFYIGMYGYDKDGTPIDGVGSADNIGYDDEYLEEMTKYNFNLLLGVDPARQTVTTTVSPPLDFLDRVQRSGMQMIVASGNFHVDRNAPVYDAPKVALGLAHYNAHPAVLGYDVVDEPCLQAATVIGQVADQIVAYDSEKIPFVNMWPSYKNVDELDDCNPSTVFAGDYSSYVDGLIATGNARVLSFDYYPLITKPAYCFYTRHYFDNLHIVAERAVAHDLPFFMVINSYQLDVNPVDCAIPHPTPLSIHDGIEDIRIWRYNIYSALLYGARGLLYWPREIASPNYGNPTTYKYVWDAEVPAATKDELKTIHGRLLDHSCILTSIDYRTSYHVTALPQVARETPDVNAWLGQLYPPQMAWYLFKNDPATIAIFDTSATISPAPSSALDYQTNPTATDFLAFSYLEDEAGKNYMWIMNKDYEESLGGPAEFTLNFNGPKTVVDILGDRLCVSVNNMDVSLLPGEGKLFLVDNSIATLNITADHASDNETYAAGVINIKNGVDITGTSIVRCFAHEINVEDAVNIDGGTGVVLRAHNNYCGTFRLPAPVPGAVKMPGMKIVPNPGSGRFTLRLDGDPQDLLTITVENTLGQTVLKNTAQGNSLVEIVLHEPDGLYLVKAMQGDKLIAAEKIVIAH